MVQTDRSEPSLPSVEGMRSGVHQTQSNGMRT